MIISGNQTAVKEIMNLLDSTFDVTKTCHWCYSNFGRPIDDLKCYEKSHKLTFHIYDIEYDDNRILKCKGLNQAHYAGDGSDNLINGCVK